MKKNIVRFIFVLIWSGLIFALLTMPLPVSTGKGLPGLDKITHAFLFGFFSFLLNLSLADGASKKFLSVVFFSLITSSAYAALMEYIQSYVPSRHMSEYDFLAGVSGIIIAEIISYGWFRKKISKT